MTRAYEGDVTSGAPYGLPGEVVLGKGASEQKANMAAMFIAMESVLASGIPVTGRLTHLCCLSGETGKHAAIKSVVETTGAKADMAFLGGTSLKLSLGNRGRLDVLIKVRGRSVHSRRSKEWLQCHNRGDRHPAPPGFARVAPAGCAGRRSVADRQSHSKLSR